MTQVYLVWSLHCWCSLFLLMGKDQLIQAAVVITLLGVNLCLLFKHTD